jgi:hypothetical protein
MLFMSKKNKKKKIKVSQVVFKGFWIICVIVAVAALIVPLVYGVISYILYH